MLLAALILQPSQLIDFGHATDLLAGSEKGANVFRLNVSTAATAPVITNWAATTNTMRCWALGYFDGLYWASQYQETSAVGEPAICVSEDGVSWAIIGYLDAGDQGVVQFAGVANGYMYATVKDIAGPTYRAVSFKVPPLVNGTWTKISPADTNLFSSENLSIGSTDASSWRTTDDPVEALDLIINNSMGLSLENVEKLREEIFGGKSRGGQRETHASIAAYREYHNRCRGGFISNGIHSWGRFSSSPKDYDYTIC